MPTVSCFQSVSFVDVVSMRGGAGFGVGSQEQSFSSSSIATNVAAHRIKMIHFAIGFICIRLPSCCF